MRVAVRVEADLAGDLSLAALAGEARMSRAHFQRAFTVTVGVSPAAHVARVRVERAAFLMCVRRESLLDIALSVGFTNPDTFTRVFRRRFGCTPSYYRRRRARPVDLAPVRRAPPPDCAEFSLAPTHVVRMRKITVAFLRQTGPYEEVDASAWVRLVAWARARGISRGWCIGIGHDAPSVTAPPDLRFDAGVVVDHGTAPGAGVVVQTLPEALYAATRHVGAYGTLPAAYPEIFARSVRLRGHRLLGLPVVEIYHDATVDPGRPLNSTDVLIPVVRT
jgi:AraC family transcriptional regulator